MFFCCLFLSSSYKGSTFINFLLFKNQWYLDFLFILDKGLKRQKIKTFKEIIGVKYMCLINKKIRNTVMNPDNNRRQGWTVVCCLLQMTVLRPTPTYIWLLRPITAILTRVIQQIHFNVMSKNNLWHACYAKLC